MTQLAEIDAHIGNMAELLDIVGAMRSLASMRVQEAHRALPGVRRYAEAMATAIGDACLLADDQTVARPSVEGRHMLVLCTAEHGFVGGFNERLVEAAVARAQRDTALFVLGSRGAALVNERGLAVAWAYPMATRPEGVLDTIQRLTSALYRAVLTGDGARVEVIFTRHRQGRSLAIERRTLFPVDLASLAMKTPRLPPLHNLPAEVLLEKLVADYVFALLTEAAIESVASENAARFAAMESAHDNVSKKLDRLHQEGRQARQEEITTELLDLVTGTEALQVAGRLRRRRSFPEG